MKRLFVSCLLLLTWTSASRSQDMTLSQILVEGQGWHAVDKSSEWTEHLLGQAKGQWNVRLPGGRSYAAISGKPGLIFNNDPEKKMLDVGIKVTGLTLWPDQGTLVAAEEDSKYLWAFRIEADGSLSAKEPYYALRTKPGKKSVGTNGLTVDSKGRLYAATELGVQVFDPTGRLCGVISKPATGGQLCTLAFGEDDRSLLFAVCNDKVYFRKTNTEGIVGRDAKSK
ncbi:MAG: SMP-30/gluconolactonase/LRE family protein [Gemmataceae bacterium]